MGTVFRRMPRSAKVFNFWYDIQEIETKNVEILLTESIKYDTILYVDLFQPVFIFKMAKTRRVF